MRKLLIATPLVAMVLVAVPFAQSEAGGPAANVTLVCKDGDPNWAPVFPCGLPELTPNPTKGSYGTGNAFGKIHYKTVAANNQFALRASGLEANTWYLVTMQEPWRTGAGLGNGPFTANEAICLFDIKSGGFEGDDEFCDVALVKTNMRGDINETIPTDSGLTGDGAGPVCLTSNVPWMIPGPNLGVPGDYTPLTMVMKNVGHGDDYTTPNCATLMLGGSAELFEMSELPGFTN